MAAASGLLGGSPTLRSNIIANLAGGGWNAALTVLVTPLQVKYLGIEAYGLVGFIAILQVILGAFDLGLSVSMTKIVSSDHSEGLSDSQELVASASTVYWFVALAIAVGLWFGAGWIATRWLRSTLNQRTVILAVRIIALYVAVRWPVAFYVGLITGLQRLDLVNLIKSVAVSLRLLGGAALLLLVPRLDLFLEWFAFSAAVELLMYVVVSYRLMPILPVFPAFSWPAIRSIWRFSSALNIIALTSVAFTQLDRLLISKMLNLEALGYYSLAYNAAISVSLIQTSINSASFPAFSLAHSGKRLSEFVSRYEKASAVMGFVTALPCFLLIFFGRDLLRVWVSDRAAANAYFPLALLMIGFFCNAVVSNPYFAAIASGEPYLPLRVNLLGLVLYVPVLFWFIREAGIVGAAVSWALLNLYYLGVLLPWVHRRVFDEKPWRWLWRNVVPFALTGAALFGGMKILCLVSGFNLCFWTAVFVGPILYAAIGLRLLPPKVREDVAHIVCRFGMPRWLFQ